MAEQKNLSDVLKSISKKYGDSVVKRGVDSLDVDGILSLGTPTFDFAVYGGIPEGRIVEFCGQEGGGKTTTAFMVAASYQREEIKRNPDNPRSIILLDRFWWSTYVYGLANGLEKEIIEKIIAPEIVYWNQMNVKRIFLVERECRERDFSTKIDENIVNMNNYLLKLPTPKRCEEP